VWWALPLTVMPGLNRHPVNVGQALHLIVMPAKAGIQIFKVFDRNDDRAEGYSRTMSI